VDVTHAALAGKVLDGNCFSNGSGKGISTCPKPPCAVRTCPNPSCPQGQASCPEAGINCNIATSLDCAHGTEVAGIAAGLSQDANFPSGVAKDANIISVQIASCNIP
jgi:subtilisin family serine protease